MRAGLVVGVVVRVVLRELVRSCSSSASGDRASWSEHDRTRSVVGSIERL